MAQIDQGCVEITTQQLQSPTIHVTAAFIPAHAAVTVHQGPAWGPQSNVLRSTVSVKPAVSGQSISIPTRGLRLGDCACWIAYG